MSDEPKGRGLVVIALLLSLVALGLATATYLRNEKDQELIDPEVDALQNKMDAFRLEYCNRHENVVHSLSLNDLQTLPKTDRSSAYVAALTCAASLVDPHRDNTPFGILSHIREKRFRRTPRSPSRADVTSSEPPLGACG